LYQLERKKGRLRFERRLPIAYPAPEAKEEISCCILQRTRQGNFQIVIMALLCQLIFEASPRILKMKFPGLALSGASQAHFFMFRYD
jgi:hypothetical protein